MTRVGLAIALQRTQVVVDVSDGPSFDDDAVLEFVQTSSRNLAAAEAAAGVGHHITLSVVGAQRLPNNGYMRAKVAQEALVRGAAIPHTILRSTQSYELLRSAADAATDGDIVRISPALVQPIAAADIAVALADVCERAPTGTTDEVAGPDPMRFVELVAQMLHAQHDHRRAEADPAAAYCGSVLDDNTLMPGPHARAGSTRLATWLAQHVTGGAARTLR